MLSNRGVLLAGIKTKNPGLGHGVLGLSVRFFSPISTAPCSAEEHEEEAISKLQNAISNTMVIFYLQQYRWLNG
ncbi:MAG: hypothetical protein B7X50_07565 [Alishewanella sp. 34-51-39]|nr:MAG: hypothetical protein B7X50_07565 [Alishewanella sp. 34-51-39]